jgi:hypothetical protein
MERHRFDPLSFIFGLLFVVVAGLTLVGADVFDLRDLAWVAPAILVVAGGALLVSATSRGPEDDRADTPPTPDAAPDEGRGSDVHGEAAEAPRASDAPTMGAEREER